jgi:hypothetical protein
MTLLAPDPLDGGQTQTGYLPKGVTHSSATPSLNMRTTAQFPNRAVIPSCSTDIFPEQCNFVCAPCPPKPCCCAPKTRINTCISIKYGMKEISFLLANWSCAPEVIPAHLHCWVVDVRERGDCRVRARMKPVRADITGRAWFSLPEAFFRLGEGTYEFDFNMDGVCVLTQCMVVSGVRPYLKDVGFADPIIYCNPPVCAPQLEEADYSGQLLSGDCDAEC